MFSWFWFLLLLEMSSFCSKPETASPKKRSAYLFIQILWYPPHVQDHQLVSSYRDILMRFEFIQRSWYTSSVLSVQLVPFPQNVFVSLKTWYSFFQETMRNLFIQRFWILHMFRIINWSLLLKTSSWGSRNYEKYCI